MSCRRDIVVMGASAGGVEAFCELLSQLPAGFPAVVALALHRGPGLPSRLARVLSRRSRIGAIEPANGDPLCTGCVYVAPPDQHMVLEKGKIGLHRGPKQHHVRPAIDPLFESAAEVYGPRVVGVLLTGNLGDGVNGLIRIASLGGLSLSQDPDEAMFPSMPINALRSDHVDLVFRLSNLPSILLKLVEGGDVRELGPPPR